MGRGLVKINDWLFAEWSTVVDGPVWLGNLKELKEEYEEERIERCLKYGHSFRDSSPDFKYWERNHAGDNEECLDEEGFIKMYQSLAMEEPDDLHIPDSN